MQNHKNTNIGSQSQKQPEKKESNKYASTNTYDKNSKTVAPTEKQEEKRQGSRF